MAATCTGAYNCKADQHVDGCFVADCRCSASTVNADALEVLVRDVMDKPITYVAHNDEHARKVMLLVREHARKLGIPLSEKVS